MIYQEYGSLDEEVVDLDDYILLVDEKTDAEENFRDVKSNDWVTFKTQDEISMTYPSSVLIRKSIHCNQVRSRPG